MGRSRTRSRSRARSRTRSRSRADDGSSRARSRSRERRRRSRSGERSRPRWEPAPATQAPSDALQAMQAIAAMQQQHQLILQRQMLAAAAAAQQQSQVPGMFGAMPGIPGAAAAPHPLLPTGAANVVTAAPPAAAPVNDMALDAPPTAANRKQRELYIGNLTLGIVTGDMLRELFNMMLAHMVPDPATNPPVMDCRNDPSGRFAFIEFRTAALALAALQLDKIELAGRTLNIGRPKGYVEPPAMEQQAKLSAAQMFAAQVSGGPTHVVLLTNLMDATAMRDEEEKRLLYDDVYAEACRNGTVTGVAIPVPPPGVPNGEPARVYVRFTTVDAAAKCRAAMDGRDFDSRKVRASYVPDDVYYRAAANEWVSAL